MIALGVMIAVSRDPSGADELLPPELTDPHADRLKRSTDRRLDGLADCQQQGALLLFGASGGEVNLYERHRTLFLR